MVSSEELECGCCYDLLLDPTTLTCGHSFCRYCLAKWFKTSKKTECPECRQMWTGFPSVNVRLRSIIEKAFPEKLSTRVNAQMRLLDYQETLNKFEEHGKKNGGQPSRVLPEEQLKLLVGGAVLVIAALLIVLLIVMFYWLLFTEATPREVIYSKTADKWSVKEVMSWAKVFSSQLDYDYSERFAKAGLHGEVLLSLSEDDLATAPLNISTALHRKIIFSEITKLKKDGVRQPVNLWEYKDANRISSVFLLFMLQDFPRLTILYYRIFHYHGVFLPFMETVIDKAQRCEHVESLNDSDDSNDALRCSQEEITSMDTVWFYTKAMLLPYYLVSRFSFHFVDVHFYIMWFIISHSFMLTVREALQIKRVPIRLNTLFNTVIDATFSFVLTLLIYRIATWFIPAFILDFCFFAKLYYGPVDTANSIRHGHLQTHAIGKVLNVAFGAVNKVVAFILFLFNARRRP